MMTYKTMSPFYRYLLLFFLFGILAGCAGIKSPETIVPSSSDYLDTSISAATLLAYFDQLRLLSPAEFVKETERVRKNYAKEKSVLYQLQYAVALSFSGGDTRHAQQLLEPLVKETGRRDHSLHALVTMLYTDLAERQRLEEALQTQTRRADDLENKLEALKDIEKKMMQRERVIKEKP